MHEDMTPENQLCLLLSRGQIHTVQQRILSLLASTLRWSIVLRDAYTHQVYPLLFRNLRELGFAGVPEESQAELRRSYLANGLHNQLLAEELARVLGFLADAGIPAIPLKGVALAQALYGDLAARVCADIDILVPVANLAHALELILASDYRDEFQDPFFAKLVLRHGRHYQFVREHRGVSFRLEVHWELVQYSSRNEEATQDLWAEARNNAFFGVPAFSPSLEWEFLYLSIHAGDHGWQSLKWLADIHQMASSMPVDWRIVMTKAKRFELDRVVRQTLTASALLLETPLPSGYSLASLPRGSRLFPRAPFPAGARGSTFFHFRMLARPIDRLKCFATIMLVPKPPDRDFLRLPASISFLYYVVRPVRLVWRSLSQIFSPVFREPADVEQGQDTKGDPRV